jgi:hypothetical protein
MIKLTTYTEVQKSSTAFYIQSKGCNAGKIMVDPSKNCFEVEIDPNIFDDKYAFYLFQTIYINGYFKKYITVSVIPFLTKKSAFDAINDFFQTKLNK